MAAVGGLVMRFKLDENLSLSLQPVLAAMGHDVETAKSERLLGRPDTEVAAAAFAEGRIVLTLDIEFADLRKYPPGAHPGVVLFRPFRLGIGSVERMVHDFVESADWPELQFCVVVVDSDRVRVRRPEAG